jgi:ParB-like chromosome segregation protein Spo0J
MVKIPETDLKIFYVDIKELKDAEYNARNWTEQATIHLKKSTSKFGIVDPLIVNSNPIGNTLMLQE